MMATERSFPLYLLATVVISSVKLSLQAMPYNRSTANITDNVSVVRSQCLSRCGLEETEYDKTRFSGARQNVKNSNCYRKCIESAAQKRLQSTKRKHRSSMVMTSGYTKYGCPLKPEIVGGKIGDIENLAVAFLQRRGQDGNLIWIANVTWDATFSNEGTVNQWKGFLITWSMPRNAPDSFEIYCRFLSKNFTSTSFIIESNSTGWVYPGAIGLRVLFYPSTKEHASGFDLVLFDPKESAASSMPRIMSSVKKNETVTYPMHPYVSSQDTGSPTAKHPPTPGKRAWQSGLAIFLGCFVGVIIAMLVVYVTWKRRRNRPTHVQDEGNFEYDLSIFYSTQDEKWVTEELMPLLETQNNFKCFVHFRDFEVGRVLNENIADAVYKCRKNLAVVSRNFLKSNYCKEELDMSLERVQRLGNNSLIVLNLDGVSEDKLPKAVLRRTFMNLTNSLEQRTWKTRLIKQISVEDKKAPSLNGNPARSFVRLQKDNTVTVVQKPNASRNENEV